MNNKFSSKKAFTLVEMIIYIAIAAFVVVSVTTFTWGVMGSNTKVDVSSELTQNARLILDKITLEARESDGVVTGSSTFDTHPGVLTLDRPGVGTDIIFDTYTTSVNVGGEDITIRKLRMKDGANPYYDITTDKIDVTDFIIINFQRDDETPNINIEFTLDFVDAGDDPNRADKNITVESGVSLRISQ